MRGRKDITGTADHVSAAPVQTGPFALDPASLPRAVVAAGTVEDFELVGSRAYPRHAQRWSLYRPAGAAPDGALPFMVFLDGPTAQAGWHVPIVLDNLIADARIPAMAAIFIESGHDLDHDRNDQPARLVTRSIEYDTVDDTYARFLLEDLLPRVETLQRLGEGGIAGASSGAICAFNVAWHRPDRFARVFGAIPSFVDIRGGHCYPARLRSTPRKPIRVFLQEGTADTVASYPHFDWPAGNRAMAAALNDCGYDARIVWGDGGHDLAHSAALLPEALEWLWRPLNDG